MKEKIGQGRQRKTKDPCETCFLHRDRCLCAFIPRLHLNTKLSLIIHAKELKRTTNTGVLATKALANSSVFVRGQIGNHLELSSLLHPAYRPMLLYPVEGAIELTREFVIQSELPVHLIVPDGNWRQASKVHYRHPELRDVPRVTIKNPNRDRHRLRTETTEEGMATLQAIAYALRVIEGESVGNELLKLYQLKLDRTLEGRGLR